MVNHANRAVVVKHGLPTRSSDVVMTLEHQIAVTRHHGPVVTANVGSGNVFGSSHLDFVIAIRALAATVKRHKQIVITLLVNQAGSFNRTAAT